jgi:Proton-conducting membrane transporter
MIFFSILILIVAIALPSINNNISSNIYIRISSIILLYSGLLALNAINIPSLGSGIGLYSGLFHVTLISQLMDCFIFLIGSLILVSWPLINNKKYNPSNGLKNKINKINTYAIEYSLVILFSTLGASLLISSSDIVSMYLSIELQSFGLYIISTIFRDSDSATSAGLKYFLLGAEIIRTYLDLCLKLSNSGDTLKLLIPSHSRKAMSGWINHPCTVISQEIFFSENEMGYRGSKSIMNNFIVKEQRVDGSYCIKTKIMQLRCTLKSC